MSYILWAIGVYILAGIVYLSWIVISEKDFDIGQGWVPNLVAYPMCILLWPIWLRRYLKKY